MSFNNNNPDVVVIIVFAAMFIATLALVARIVF